MEVARFVISVLLLMGTMAIKDVLGTAMVVYEGKGNGKLAGIMDSSSDVVSFVYTVIGVDALNKAGWSLEAAIMLIAVAFTSYNVTKFTTNFLANRGKA
jgi:hypothetical protein